MKIYSILKSILHKLSEPLIKKEFKRLRKELENGPRFCKKTVEFLGYRINIVDNISFIWQFKDIFVDEIYRFESPSENPLIYDCGANVGMASIYFKKNYPGARIKAFEADPRIAEVLEDNIILNDLGDVQVLPKAVWISDKPIFFGQDGADGGSVYKHQKRIKVDAVRLKNLILAEDKIDFLKLDIEGAETEVLLDCSDVLYKINHIFMEYHSLTELPQKLDALLKVLNLGGFRYYISTIGSRKLPFMSKTEKAYMDMQLNIFAYRIE